MGHAFSFCATGREEKREYFSSGMSLFSWIGIPSLPGVMRQACVHGTARRPACTTCNPISKHNKNAGCGLFSPSKRRPRGPQSKPGRIRQFKIPEGLISVNSCLSRTQFLAVLLNLGVATPDWDSHIKYLAYQDFYIKI